MANFEKQKIKWEKQRTKGKTKYVLFHVILWVIYSAILVTVNTLIFNRPYFSHLNELIMSYVIGIIIFGLTGVFIGNMSWRANIKKFKN